MQELVCGLIRRLIAVQNSSPRIVETASWNFLQEPTVINVLHQSKVAGENYCILAYILFSNTSSEAPLSNCPAHPMTS